MHVECEHFAARMHAYIGVFASERVLVYLYFCTRTYLRTFYKTLKTNAFSTISGGKRGS